ncbi:gustatory receptor 68a-like [Schistocerca americana]|uniref:gustatory receptor 68a-like n=1 Tax=Schistocerca americana TaxID=7009 RepID=UPI001F4FD260|nr:gustatory receptor 68a-like [Schistocerca americana]XP_047106638.1 gustatory receptor 68a-like [Schistocerca piceifrons]
MVLELRERFCSLNADLRSLLPLSGDPTMWRPMVGPSRRVAPAGRLRQLRKAQMALSHAAEFLQSYFGLPMAFNVAYCLCSALCSAYEILMQLVRPHWIVEFSYSESSAVSGLWAAYHSLNILLVCLSCSATADEAAACGLFLLRASVMSDRRCAELEAFLRLTLHSPPLRFTAAGFVTLDRRLLVSALAAIVTYLVILGQLSSK